MHSKLHQPWEIRIFHWLFFLAIILKFWSGFYISSPHPLLGFSGMYSARMVHATMTPVLAALLLFRFYFALAFGDWRELIPWHRQDFSQIRPWSRYFLFMTDTPPLTQNKYSIAQRLLFAAIILSMPFFFTTGVIMLNFPSFRWLNVFYGGQGIARVVHFLFSVFLAAVVALHIYLALSEHLGRLKAIFTGRLLINETEGKGREDDQHRPRGGAGKPGHVR